MNFMPRFDVVDKNNVRFRKLNSKFFLNDIYLTSFDSLFGFKPVECVLFCYRYELIAFYYVREDEKNRSNMLD